VEVKFAVVGGSEFAGLGLGNKSRGAMVVAEEGRCRDRWRRRDVWRRSKWCCSDGINIDNLALPPPPPPPPTDDEDDDDEERAVKVRLGSSNVKCIGEGSGSS
jgi:hypothetical protein